MKNLISTLFLGGALVLGGCNINNQKENYDKQDSLKVFLAKDSFILNSEIVIKQGSEDGEIKQYNNQGLLLREIEQLGSQVKNITDYQYNKKSQLIKSIRSNFYEGKLEGKDSILYQYDEKGRLSTKEFFPAPGYDFGSALFIYKYNNKKQIEKETRVSVIEQGKKTSKWVENLNYTYDFKGRQIIKKWEDKSGISYYLNPNDSTEIRCEDSDKDGRIDNFLISKE